MPKQQTDENTRSYSSDRFVQSRSSLAWRVAKVGAAMITNPCQVVLGLLNICV